MFKEVIEKKGKEFTPQKALEFLKDFTEREGEFPETIDLEVQLDSIAVRDTATKEKITFTNDRIYIDKKYLKETEEHENGIDSIILSNLYSDIVLSMPETPIWDIYGEYDWYYSDVEGIYNGVRKADL
jgi:hypothetical protein